MASFCFGDIKLTICPTSSGRSALTYALSAVESLGAGPTLQIVSFDCSKSRYNLFIQVLAADNWGANLLDCATKLFDAVTALPSCEDLVLKYADFPGTSESIRSEAHKKRVREER
jgi:hypothetical protein